MAGCELLRARMLVGCDDTIGDLALGLLGSVGAGAVSAWWERTGHPLRAGE